MGTTIRPELSEKNPYWIERHRYYELKHFCLQYPIWKKAYAALDGLSRRPSDLEVFSKKGEISDPTVRCVEARSYYIERMKTALCELSDFHIEERIVIKDKRTGRIWR